MAAVSSAHAAPSAARAPTAPRFPFSFFRYMLTPREGARRRTVVLPLVSCIFLSGVPRIRWWSSDWSSTTRSFLSCDHVDRWLWRSLTVDAWHEDVHSGHDPLWHRRRFSQLHESILSFVTSQSPHGAYKKMEELLPQRSVDLSGDGQEDIKLLRHPSGVLW